MRLIDADALKKTLEKVWNIHDDQDFANKDVWREIENAPTIEMQRTAKVTHIHEEYDLEAICYSTYGDCDCCGTTVELGDKFCCECGAKLDWSGK